MSRKRAARNEIRWNNKQWWISTEFSAYGTPSKAVRTSWCIIEMHIFLMIFLEKREEKKKSRILPRRQHRNTEKKWSSSRISIWSDFLIHRSFFFLSFFPLWRSCCRIIKAVVAALFFSLFHKYQKHRRRDDQDRMMMNSILSCFRDQWEDEIQC